MKRLSLFVAIIIFFCNASVFGLDYGTIIDVGVIGNYEEYNSAETIKIQSGNVFGELSLGCYFSIVTLRIFFDIGTAFGGSVNEEYALLECMDALNFKIGFEVGVKVIDDETFCLTIPLGFSYSNTTYTEKIPIEMKTSDAYYSYAKKSELESKLIYQYGNVYSGIDASIIFNDYLSLMIYSHIGYPFGSELEYVLTAPSGYVWKATGTKDLTETYKVGIFSVCAGVNLRIKIPDFLLPLILWL